MDSQQIIRRVQRVGQPAPPPAELMLAGDSSLVRRVWLEDWQAALYLRVALQQDQVFADVLTLLQGSDVYIYLEVTGHNIDGVAVPWVGNVLELSELKNGDVLVSLSECSSGLVLRAGVPDRGRLFQRLCDGLKTAEQPEPRALSTAVVQRRSTGEIIYVELVKPALEEDCVKPNAQPSQVDIIRALQPVAREQIDAVARSLASGTCDINTTDPQCIPFTYVINFCWFRAHVMCLALANANIQSAKLWAFAIPPLRLKVPTDCLPECVTNWAFHVVPVVCAEQFDLRVVDPSLFGDKSVPLSTFLDLMHPAPNFVYTDATVYDIRFGGEPAAACATRLQRERLQANAGLQLTKSFPEGPPPYQSCRPTSL